MNKKLAAALAQCGFEVTNNAARGVVQGFEMNAAYNALAEAMAAIVRKADKSELKTALDKASEILADTSKYVEESVAGLQAAADAPRNGSSPSASCAISPTPCWTAWTTPPCWTSRARWP